MMMFLMSHSHESGVFLLDLLKYFLVGFIRFRMLPYKVSDVTLQGFGCYLTSFLMLSQQSKCIVCFSSSINISQK